MRLLAVVILASLFTSTLAIKGATQVGSVRRAVKEKTKDGALKEAKDGKKKKKDDKKKDGKKMKGNVSALKECKKAKKAKKEPKTRLLQEDVVDSAPVLAPSSLPYCLHGALSAQECRAAKKGRANKGEKSVKGDLNLDIKRNRDISSEEVLEKVSDILRSKTSPDFLGCPRRRRHLIFGKGKEGEEEEEEEKGDSPPNIQDEQGDNLIVTGVDFTNLVISENGKHQISRRCLFDKEVSILSHYSQFGFSSRLWIVGQELRQY